MPRRRPAATRRARRAGAGTGAPFRGTTISTGRVTARRVLSGVARRRVLERGPADPARQHHRHRSGRRGDRVRRPAAVALSDRRARRCLLAARRHRRGSGGPTHQKRSPRRAHRCEPGRYRSTRRSGARSQRRRTDRPRGGTPQDRHRQKDGRRWLAAQCASSSSREVHRAVRSKTPAQVAATTANATESTRVTTAPADITGSDREFRSALARPSSAPTAMTAPDTASPTSAARLPEPTTATATPAAATAPTMRQLRTPAPSIAAPSATGSSRQHAAPRYAAEPKGPPRRDEFETNSIGAPAISSTVQYRPNSNPATSVPRIAATLASSSAATRRPTANIAANTTKASSPGCRIGVPTHAYHPSNANRLERPTTTSSATVARSNLGDGAVEGVRRSAAASAAATHATVSVDHHFATLNENHPWGSSATTAVTGISPATAPSYHEPPGGEMSSEIRRAWPIGRNPSVQGAVSVLITVLPLVVACAG